MERKRAFAIHSGVFHPLPACSLGDVTLQPPGSPHTSWKHFLLPLIGSSKLSLEHLACCLLLELWGVPGGSWWVFWRTFCVCVFVCVCVFKDVSAVLHQIAKKDFPLSPSDSVLWDRKVASNNQERFASIRVFLLGLNEPYNSVNLHSAYSKSPHYIKDLL